MKRGRGGFLTDPPCIEHTPDDSGSVGMGQTQTRHFRNAAALPSERRGTMHAQGVLHVHMKPRLSGINTATLSPRTRQEEGESGRKRGGGIGGEVEGLT